MPKKKNIITLLVLCVVLAGGLVLYFLMPEQRGEDSADSGTESEESIQVDTIKTDEIQTITITNKTENASEKSGETYKLYCEGNAWKMDAAKKKIPLDEEAVNTMLDSLTSVTASKEWEKKDSQLADYGLDQPVLKIQITMSDGTEYQYSFGDTVPVIGGYYGLAGGDKVYCMSEDMYAAFAVSSNSLIQMDELPEIETDDITYISVDNKEGTDFEAAKVSKKKRVNPDSKWNITKPYAVPLAADPDNWDTTLETFTALSFDQTVDYQTEKLGKYGLTNPSAVITVKYKKDKRNETLQLYIGEKADDGYYVCLKGSHNVYRMSKDTVNSLTGLDAYTVMDQSIYSTPAAEIKSCEVTYGTTTQKITSKEASEGGAFETVYSSLSKLTYSSKGKASVKPKSSKPVLTVVYHEADRDVTVQYLPYDGTNFYRVKRDGMDYFLTDKRNVDAIITNLKKTKK